MAALEQRDATLPVEPVPAEILAKDLPILAKAHGVYRTSGFTNEPMNWYLKHEHPPRYSDLRGIPLQGCKLEDANLRYTYLEDADLSKCELKDVDLTGANLRGANLTGAVLNGVRLDHVVLVGAHMSGAKLMKASLRQALLYGSTIVGAYLPHADLEGAQFADFELTVDLKHLKGYTGSDVDQIRLSSPANLSGANLLGANLSGAILGNANLKGASLFEAIFENTLIDTKQFSKAFNYRYVRPGTSSTRINIPAQDLQNVEAFHEEARRFFASNGMGEMAAEYHFWGQEIRTYKPQTPFYVKILRIVFMKWPYGYGSRPMWLFYYSFCVVVIFAALYVLLTINLKKSGLYRVYRENGRDEVILLSWRKGLLVADCLYFSLLSFATFGYGVFQPRQWIEFFRFEPVQLRPLGWARILVGLEAAFGIYLLALLTTVLFGKD
ncbi:MAG: pentapeptide repeat-containing protein [Acidiferrobacterales bacterium]|nr:pentapeptide repeat-containing protein [Acidiferrobacterales bacterium]